MQLGAGFDFRSTDVTGQAYNDGTWHKVEIERHNRTLVMSVDGKVEVGLQVMASCFSDCMLQCSELVWFVTLQAAYCSYNPKM